MREREREREHVCVSSSVCVGRRVNERPKKRMDRRWFMCVCVFVCV